MAPKRRARPNVLSKLETKVEEGNYYEALQMYKTLYSRHVGKSEFDKATGIVATGATTLLKHKQMNAGTELGLLLFELYEHTKQPVTEETKALVTRISNAYTRGPEQIAFLKAALKWTSARGPRQRGDPEIRMVLAHTCKECGDFAAAAQHYLFAEQPAEFASMLWEWSSKGYRSERDLFIARVVLQFLSLENLRDANAVFDAFNDKLAKKNAELDSPLMNFTRFLLLTCERDAQPLFHLLQQKYAASLARDEMFSTYMTLIGQKFFNIQPPPSMAGMLQNMMGMFGGA